MCGSLLPLLDPPWPRLPQLAAHPLPACGFPRKFSGQIKPEAMGAQTRWSFGLGLARHWGRGVWLQNGESLRRGLPTQLLTLAPSILPVS